MRQFKDVASSFSFPFSSKTYSEGIYGMIIAEKDFRNTKLSSYLYNKWYVSSSFSLCSNFCLRVISQDTKCKPGDVNTIYS
jgi:hypothetical protein